MAKIANWLIAGLGEDLEQRLPDIIAEKLKNADAKTDAEGLLHDLLCSIPSWASPAFHIAAQVIKSAGPGWKALGEFVETIPPTSRALRQTRGKTVDEANADLVNFYKIWRTGGKMSEEQKNLIAADEKKPAEEKPVEEWETVLSRGFPDLIHRRTIRMIALICFEDSKAGNNYVFGTDVAARNCLAAWYDAVRSVPEQVREGLASGGCDNAGLLDDLASVSRLDPKSVGYDQKLATARRALFQNNIDAINTALTNFGAKNKDSVVGAGARDVVQTFSGLVGHFPGGQGESVRKILGYGASTVSFSIVTVGLVMAYVMALLYAASTDTLANPTLDVFAYRSMYWLMGLPIAGMIFGSLFAIRSSILGLAVQTWSLLVGVLISPILIGTAFTLDAILPIETRWGAMVLGPVWVIGWALISMGLLQKAVNEVGVVETFIASIFSEKFAADLKTKLAHGQWLAKIADTIAYAVLLIWVVAVPLAKLQKDYGLSQDTRLLILGMVGLFGLLSVFMGRAIVHGLGPGKRDPTEAQKEANQKRDSGLVSKVQRSWIPLGLVVLALFLVVPTLDAVKNMNDPTGLNVSNRVTAVADHVTDTSLNWIQKTTGTPTAPSAVQTSGGNTGSGASAVTNNPAPVKASGGSHKSKREKMCDAYGGKPACEAYVEKFDEPAPFPCPCQ